MAKTRFACLVSLLLVALATGNAQTEEKVRVMFTAPGTPAEGRVERRFVQLCAQAQKSIDGAFYEIASTPAAEALCAAKKRGVVVRLVLDDHSAGTAQVRMLLDCGIQPVYDPDDGLMHDKFAIFDSTLVWTGSFNLTHNGSFRNQNNVLELKDSGIAALYLDEFREMYADRIFRNNPSRSPLPFARRSNAFKFDNGSQVVVMFSPDDDVEPQILNLINGARKSVIFMAFSFTSDAIGEAMISASKRGLDVQGIMEYNGTGSSWSEYAKLRAEGINVWRDSSRFLLHHKVIVIDGAIVITGSYNFSRNAASSNDENMVVLFDPEIATEYLREYDRLKRETGSLR